MPRIGEVIGDNTQYYEVEEGSTINDFMLMRYPELKNFPVPVVAGMNKPGVVDVKSPDDVFPVLRKDWDKPLKKGDAVAVVAVMRPMGGGGGGSGGVFQIVLGVIMMVVGALLWWTGVGSAAFVQGLVMMGAAMTLSGIVGMMNQPKLPSGAVGNEEASPTYSLNGSSNQARLLQPIPEGFGKIQVTPDVVAQPYYTYANNDQYVYQVFGIGRGSYQVDTMSFGDEIFWRNGALDTSSSLIAGSGDIEVQIVEPGGAVTLFPDNVESNQNVRQIRLFPNNDPEFSGWMGPYVSSPPGTHGTKFQIDFILPRGIGQYDDEGDLNGHTVSVEIRYRKIDNFGNALGDWAFTRFVLSGATLTAQRRSMFITAEDGRYEFSFINNVAGNNNTARPWLDEVYVDGLRCYLPGSLKYTQSVIAIRIKANNLLSQGAQQQFRTVQTRKLPIYNPATKQWSEPVPTRRLDAAIAWMCKCDWGGRLTDDRIDLVALWYCQTKCDENGWNFDTFIDSAYTVYDLIIQSCLPFRIFPRIIGDKVSFLFDEKNRPVKHVFTPRDIIRGSLKPSWATHTDATPDDIIVSYLDEDINYARREVQATLPGSESREPKYLQYPIGICNRKTAHDYGIYTAACNKYRRLQLEFGVETMGRMLYIGDVVSVQHPRLRSAGSGKVVDWNEADSLIYVDTMPTADARPIEPENLWMVFSDPQGLPFGPVKLDWFENCVAKLNIEDYNLVTQQQQSSLFTWASAGYQNHPTTWALQTGRNIDRRYIIKNVSFQDLEHATLTVMNDDPRVFEQRVPIPAWEYRQNNAMWENLLPPDGFAVTYVITSGVVRLSWRPSVGAATYEIQYGVMIENLDRITGILNTSIDISIEKFTFGAAHFFEVRAATTTAISKWARYIAQIGGTSA